MHVCRIPIPWCMTITIALSYAYESSDHDTTSSYLEWSGLEICKQLLPMKAKWDASRGGILEWSCRIDRLLRGGWRLLAGGLWVGCCWWSWLLTSIVLWFGSLCDVKVWRWSWMEWRRIVIGPIPAQSTMHSYMNWSLSGLRTPDLWNPDNSWQCIDPIDHWPCMNHDSDALSMQMTIESDT